MYNHDVINVGVIAYTDIEWNYKQVGSHNLMPDFIPDSDDDDTCGKGFEGEIYVDDDEDEWDNYD